MPENLRDLRTILKRFWLSIATSVVSRLKKKSFLHAGEREYFGESKFDIKLMVKVLMRGRRRRGEQWMIRVFVDWRRAIYICRQWCFVAVVVLTLLFVCCRYLFQHNTSSTDVVLHGEPDSANSWNFLPVNPRLLPAGGLGRESGFLYFNPSVPNNVLPADIRNHTVDLPGSPTFRQISPLHNVPRRTLCPRHHDCS